MIRIEALTLEQAFKDASSKLKCSVSEVDVEIVQKPSNGFLGFFKKSAIIVAVKKVKKDDSSSIDKRVVETKIDNLKETKIENSTTFLDDVLMPQSFVTTQEEEKLEVRKDAQDVAREVEDEINLLFRHSCFNLDKIEVSVYDENTLLVEFRGEDAALLIGKEGYRYKALSYMIFNWINSKYQLQLRLEIAEFLKNQEEAIFRYLSTLYDVIDSEGRIQTKTLDGVLIQIALKELRVRYPNKYVAIRTTKDGLKYIIVNEYRAY